MTNLEKKYITGYNRLPSGMAWAQNLLLNSKTPVNPHLPNSISEGISFYQGGQINPKDKDKSNIICYRCSKSGH